MRRGGWLALFAFSCYRPQPQVFRPQPQVGPNYTVAPARLSGPSVPVCWDRPAQDASGALSDVVTCQGDYRAPYGAMKAAGFAQASRYALTVGKTHVCETAEVNWLTMGEVSSVSCNSVTREPTYYEARNYPLVGWPRPAELCGGGVVVPGTAGHVLQLTISILGPDEAARRPEARRAFDVLGYRDPSPSDAHGDVSPSEPALK